MNELSIRKKFKCEKCCWSFSLKKYLLDHQTVHCEFFKYFCSTCLNQYKYKRGLIRHMKLKHLKL